jgi:hypothetical protein
MSMQYLPPPQPVCCSTRRPPDHAFGVQHPAGGNVINWSWTLCAQKETPQMFVSFINAEQDCELLQASKGNSATELL